MTKLVWYSNVLFIIGVIIRFGNANRIVFEVNSFPLEGDQFPNSDACIGKNKKY
jgi:hypothetical protein